MVKDKHVNALNFMENMKFNDSCIGFAAETKQCDCLVQFLGEDTCQVIQRISLSACHLIYGMTLSEMMMTKSWQKKKSLTLWTFSCCQKCKRNSILLWSEKGTVFCDQKECTFAFQQLVTSLAFLGTWDRLSNPGPCNCTLSINMFNNALVHLYSCTLVQYCYWSIWT